MGQTLRQRPLTGYRCRLPLCQGSSYSCGRVALGWGEIKDHDNGDLDGNDNWQSKSCSNQPG
jgi:hypothetical protein